MNSSVAAAILVTACSYCAAADVQDVRTLDDLRNAPKVVFNEDWDAHFGLADSGADGGPWGLVYCLITARAEAVPAALPAGKSMGGNRLGPFRYRCDPFEDRIMAAAEDSKVPAKPAEAKEWLFCNMVPLTYHLRIWTGDENVVASRQIEVKEPRACYWQTFARIDRYEDEQKETRFREVPTVKPWAAAPAFDGRVNLLPAGDLKLPHSDAGKEKENQLPGGLPLLGGWDTLLAAKPAVGAVSPLGLKLSLAGDRLLIQSTGCQMLDWPDQCVLARWWVNGSPLVPKRNPRLISHAESRQIIETNESIILFTLPEWLGALRPGDKVGLQVLYSPDEHELVSDPPFEMDHMMSRIQGRGYATVPLLSNRIDFDVTAEMLAKRPN